MDGFVYCLSLSLTESQAFGPLLPQTHTAEDCGCLLVSIAQRSQNHEMNSEFRIPHMKYNRNFVS